MLLTDTTANLSALRPHQHPPSLLTPHPYTPCTHQSGGLEEELQPNYYAAYPLLMLRTVRACSQNSDGAASVRLFFTPGRAIRRE